MKDYTAPLDILERVKHDIEDLEGRLDLSDSRGHLSFSEHMAYQDLCELKLWQQYFSEFIPADGHLEHPKKLTFGEWRDNNNGV